MTNTRSVNIIKKYYRKKTRHKFDCYGLHTVLLVIIILLIITIICYHYAKFRSKQESNDALTI